MAELRADGALVAVTEHAANDRFAGEREDSGRRRHRRKRQPGDRDDVPADSLRRDGAARKRDGRDERARPSGDGDEKRRDQVRVGEARAAAGPEPGCQPVRDEIQALHGNRQAHPLEQLAQPTERPGVRSTKAAPPQHRDEWHDQRDGAVEREAPAEGDDAVVDQGNGQRDAAERAGGEAERGPLVVVERGERARDEAAEDLRDRRRDDPRQQEGCLVACERVRRQGAGELFRREDRDHGDDAERQRQPDRPGADLPGQPPGGLGGHEARQNDDTERARDQGQCQIGAVGSEEPIGLYAMPKLSGENDTQDGGRCADGRSRDSC